MALKTETVSLDTLTPDPKNARAHDERSIESIMRSLKEFGLQKPLVITADNLIACGNGTYAAAKRLGWKEIEVVRTTLTGVLLAAYKVADNRTTDLSTWDEAALAEALQGIKDTDESLLWAAGFDDQETAKLLAGEWTPPPIDEHPEASKPKGDGQSHALHFTDEQWAVIEQGITQLRNEENDLTISGSRAVELMVADYYSGGMVNKAQ